jgi:putative chitinase
MMITIELLRKLCPKTPVVTLQRYLTPLNEVCRHYEINTPNRVAGFLSNIIHESGYLARIPLMENLNYSARGLMTTFKRYFPNEQIAKEFERKPEKIANRVYSSRMGNGDESSGDGWKFRGRGAIQLTGRHNYTRFAKDVGMTLDEAVNYLETPEGAMVSCGWFFDQNNLLRHCDTANWERLTRLINGGLNGHAHRVELIGEILAHYGEKK